MPHEKGKPTPLSHPDEFRYMVRRLYPTLGAKRIVEVAAGLSTRSVYVTTLLRVHPSPYGADPPTFCMTLN